MRKKILQVILLFIALTLVCHPALVSAEKSASQVTPGSYSVTITWATDKPSSSQIEYGRNSSYGENTAEDTDLVIFHKVTISGLTPSTLYNYRVKSKDAFGNQATSSNFTFATLSDPAKNVPPQISDVEAASIVAAGPQETASEKPEQKGAPKAATQAASQLVKKEDPIEKALMEKGGILLKKGKLQIEPSTTYVYTSANRISISGYTILPVLVVGEISTSRVKRDILVESITARYGLKNDIQLELSVPYRYQHDRVSVESPASETNRQFSGLGDISSGIFYQCLYEKGLVPDLIAGISVKSRTGKEPYGRDIGLGTGHWGIKMSLVAVKSSDPAILFSSLGYTYNMERRNIQDYGNIKPGDSIDYSLGAGFALNYQLALSFSLQQSITKRMRMNGNVVTGSFTNSASLKYGVTWSISKNFSCDVSAAHGLTTDSPDFVLEVGFPYTF